jgi:O-antigen/teichoic acid export membrane protein
MRQRRLFRNVSALVLAQGVTKILNFAVSLVLVRYLGVEELGRYSYIIAYAYPFGALADFGVAAYSIREISRNLGRASVVLAVLQRAVLLLGGATAIAMIGLAMLTRHDTLTTACIVVVALTNLVSAATTPFVVSMTAREDLHLVSVYRVAAAALGVVATVAVLFWGGGIFALFAVTAGVNIAMWFVGRRLAGVSIPSVHVPLAAVRTMISRAAPFGFLLLGFALYYRIDMIMLRWLRDEGAVGLYSAAYRFLDAVILLAATLGGPLYPRLSNMMEQDFDGVRNLLENTWKPMLALGLPVAIGTFFVAQPLTVVLFGHEFVDAGPLLQILIWGSLPILLINIPSHALNAADRVWTLAGVFGLSALVNVLVNFVLIPRWGAVGASIATVLCEWLSLLLVTLLVHREFKVPFSLQGLWRYFLAGAGMALVLGLTSGSGLVLELSAGIMTYVGCLLLLGYWRSADMLAVRRLLAQ